MSELEDRINSILNDPEQMSKITNLAKSFMGGESGGQSAGSAASEDKGGGMGGIAELARSFMGGDGDSGIDAAALGRISRIMSAGGAQDREKRALLEAMKPYLSEKRREKMDKAMKIARLAKIAKIAMGESGGEDV